MASEDKVRVVRIVQYEGPRSNVERVVAQSIHGTHTFGQDVYISAATLGTYPEILEKALAEAPIDVSEIVEKGS